MAQNGNSNRSLGIYALIAWMVVNIVLFALLIPDDPTDLNNYIEVILWVASIAALFTMRKAGAAFATVVLCMTLSTSMGIVLLAYYNNLVMEPVAYVNALRIAINALAVVYMFKNIFAGKFK